MELININLSKLNGLNISDEDINQMFYRERCATVNKNPVLVVRHFQYRVEIFFKTIILNGPLGKTNYYAILQFKLEEAPMFIHLYGF